MLCATQMFERAGVSNAGVPKLPIGLMVGLVVVDGHTGTVQMEGERTRELNE